MRIARPTSLFFTGCIAVLLGVCVAVVGGHVLDGGAWLGSVPVVIVLWYGGRQPFRRWRVARQSFPAAWRAWLAEHVQLYEALDADDRRRFELDIQFFLDEQTFEAVPGVEVTDIHKLAVAAGAALLLHGRPDWELGTRRTILFYPAHFDDDYHDTPFATYDGMVHAQGPIILSIASVEEDWAQPGTGHNVVLHELAHLFDFDDSFAEGIPSLMDPKSAGAWRQLVQREMRLARVGKSLLRRYAATNPAEFFAVAVENFFDRPDRLYDRHPELFEALAAFFNLDPRSMARMDAT